MSASLRVEVATPAISGDTVQFRWTQSEPNPFQHENAFHFRYEGLDLRRFSVELFYELFLGLQLKVFAAYRKPVTVNFPSPVPRPTAEFWTAYHDADLVTIEPIAKVASYSPWSSTPPKPSALRNAPTDGVGEGPVPSRAHDHHVPIEQARSAEREGTGPSPTPSSTRAGIFFGGGKDSLLAACLMTELYGEDRVTLFQCVHPFWPGDDRRDTLANRLEQVMLRPAQAALGVAAQRAWTDYFVQLRDEGGQRRTRPHLEIYSVGFLPALLAAGVSVCMPGLERTAYRSTPTKDGGRSFYYPNSRPEVLAAQSRHYQRVLGVDLAVTNINFLFTSLMAFRLLAERYPDAVRHVSMCNVASGAKRWCYGCSKCAEYAFYTLGCDAVDPEFDYDRMFTRSRFVQELNAYLESGVDLSVHGNAPWQPFLCNSGHYLGVCNVIARMDLAAIADRLSPMAYANLSVAKALFGHAQFPGVEMIAAKGVESIGTDLARAVARIAAEHFPIVDELPGPWLAGNEPVSYDFSIRMPTRLDALDHLRS